MAHFGKTSRIRLEGVHPLLQDIALRVVLRHHDCSVIYGVRTEEEQTILVQKGLSKTMDSMHLIQEDGYGHALDLAPYPIDWDNTKRFYYFAGMVMAVAEEILTEDWYLCWGGDWDGDDDLDDQSFMDLVHWELRRKGGTIV